MQVKILNISGSETGKKNLPEQFMEEIRPDIIQRAVLVIQSHNRQPFGADPMAGKRASVRISKRRRQFRGTYGIGQSRIPRKSLSRNGTRFNWVGAFAPGTVKGRRAHPYKAEKNWSLKINTQERHKAIRSALAAVMNAEAVRERGHQLPQHYPFIVESKIETLKTTDEALQTLLKLGLSQELERCQEKRIRAGRGKTRGRKYKTKTGPLIVTQQASSLALAARNIPGVDVVEVRRLNAYLLAPGAMHGRLTLFTDGAVEEIAKNKLFTRHAVKAAKPEHQTEKTQLAIKVKPKAPKTENKTKKAPKEAKK